MWWLPILLLLIIFLLGDKYYVFVKPIKEEDVVKVQFEDIYSAIIEYYNNTNVSFVGISDVYFYIPVHKKRYIDLFKIQIRLGYEVDRMDCDDYALYYKAIISLLYNVNNVLVVIAYHKARNEGHAWNIVLFYDKENNKLVVYEVEPQTGEFVDYRPLYNNKNYIIKVII